MMWVTLLAIVFSSWMLYKCFKKAKKSVPPGPWGLPIIGYLPFLNREKPNVQFSELAKKYGDVFQLRMGSLKMDVVNSQRAVRQYYAKSGQTLSTPDLFTSHMKAETMDCFLFAPFSTKFWIHKKLLFGAVQRYTTERAKDLETNIHTIVRMLVDEANKKNRQPFEPVPYCEQSAILLAFYHSYGQLLNSLTHQEVEEALKVRTSAQVMEKKIAMCDFLPWLKWLPTIWGPISKCKKAFEQYGDWHYRKASVASG